MVRSSECTGKPRPKVLDTADIVRDFVSTTDSEVRQARVALVVPIWDRLARTTHFFFAAAVEK